jgi:thiol-disulfide isomerase/thioredoxin
VKVRSRLHEEAGARRAATRGGDKMTLDRRRFLSGAAMTIVAAQLGMIGCARDQSSEDTQEPLMSQATHPAAAPLTEMPSLDSATEWLNSQPLTAASLRGKVVLVDFWTYTCINWLRQLPYVRAWADKYKDQGLVVIGVHTPEFAFEQNVDNVRRAAKDMRVDYPVAIDSDYAIWRAFDNKYWPALYFVDAQGNIRHHHFGEGEYEQSEMVIQQLLDEAGNGGIGHELVSVDARGAEAAADWASLKSPENYVGYERTANFGSPGGALLDERRVYDAPARLRLNHWALSGDWTIGKQATVLNEANGRIAYRFEARDLHLVMGPPARGTSVRFRVLIDGQPPGAARGIDVDDGGNGTATDQRLYQLIRQPEPIADRQFEIEFLDSGVEAYAFTFG